MLAGSGIGHAQGRPKWSEVLGTSSKTRVFVLERRNARTTVEARNRAGPRMWALGGATSQPRR